MKKNIAVTDNGKQCVYIFDKNSKFQRKLELKGNPHGVTYLKGDEILIVDTNNDRIQQTNIQTGAVVKTLGKEGLGIGDFDIPGDVCLDVWCL